MARLSEQQVREKITNLFVFDYIPKMRNEVQRFMEESQSKQDMAMKVSEIVGRPVGVHLGVLRVAKPTNEIIDSLVKIYVQQTEAQKE